MVRKLKFGIKYLQYEIEDLTNVQCLLTAVVVISTLTLILVISITSVNSVDAQENTTVINSQINHSAIQIINNRSGTNNSLQLAGNSSNLFGITSNAFDLTIGNKTYTISYNISGGGKLLGVVADKGQTTLTFVLGTSEMIRDGSGRLIIEVPRDLIDSRLMNMDNEFDVRMNGNTKRYVELASSKPDSTRILQIEYEIGDRLLDIKGNQMTF